MQQSLRKHFYPIALFFVLINSITLIGESLFNKWGIDRAVVIGGNLVLFAATIASFFIFARAFKSDNPHVFGRSIYASFLIRFFSCALAAAVYILVVKKEVNKPALIICMGLYILYTFLEIRILTHLLKQRKNA